MDKPQNTPIQRGNANRRDQDASAEVPGTGSIPNLGECPTLRPKSNMGMKSITDIQIHNKTVRTLCAKFPGLHAHIIEVISIIELYLELHNKHHERAQEIVNWSGSRTNWQRKQHAAIRDGIKAGYIEEYKQMIVLSPTAERIINLYDGMYEETKEQYRAKAEARKTKPKHKRINIRRQGEPQFS